MLYRASCYVRSSDAANIEVLKFVVFCHFLSIIPKDFPKTSSMHMLLLQLSYISLFCFREKSSQKYNSAPEGCPVDWQDLMMVLCGALMKEEDFRGAIISFM